MTLSCILLSAALLFPTPQVGRPDAWHSPTNRSFTCSPSIIVAPNGRLWASWFCARLCNEEDDSYALLVTSSDGGETWKEVSWADPDRTGIWRTFDPGLWIAPDGKLHWTFTEHTLWRYPETARLGYVMFRCVFPDPCSEPAELPAVERFTADVARNAAAKKALCPSAACAYETQIVGKLSDLTDKIAFGVAALESEAAKLADAADVIEESAMIRDSVIPAMESLRAACDEAETLTERSYWPFPTYADILFSVR